ncbi:hypothetical protein B484DRAFT_425268 [Ochromonadaceae sp. CCMP2298]|nr:hypothetical protein B484DRAFT_425268 [Ochromonadaceae sp. CCMP2298]
MEEEDGGVQAAGVTDAISAMEISDTESVMQYIVDNGQDFLRLDECIDRLRQQQVQQEEHKRQSHNRNSDLWTTTWGLMLLSPELNVPSSWQHRTFMRRFRLPYQLFKQLVAQCVEVNLFQQKKQGKIPIEFEVIVDHNRKVTHCSKWFYGSWNDKMITVNWTVAISMCR